MSQQPMADISLGWIAPRGGAGGAAKRDARCECVNECGDDERVLKGLVKPCAFAAKTRAKTHALRITLATLTATLAGTAGAGEALRVAAQTLVDVCDRMEPEVTHADRATDDELTAAVARVKAVLSSGLAAKGIEGDRDA